MTNTVLMEGGVIKMLSRVPVFSQALVRIDKALVASLRTTSAEVVTGELLDNATIHAIMESVRTAYFVYPPLQCLIAATAHFAEAASEAGLQCRQHLPSA